MNIIITGASNGVGAALVRSILSRDGHRVIGIARNMEALELLRADLSDQKTDFYPLPFDLARIENYPHLILRVQEIFERVDVLINNAGSLVNKSFDELRPSELEMMIDVNLKAPFFLTQSLLPFLGEGSHVLNITSMGGIQGSVKFPGLSGYSATKGALSILTESLAVELSSKGISVNAVALGAVQTRMLTEAFPGYKAPLSAEQMAEFVSEFALNGNRFMNGKIIPVALSTP